MQKPNPFGEPLLIAFLANLVALLLMALLIVWRLNGAGQKDVAEFTLYGSLVTVFTGSAGALVQALSRDPATARFNAQAANTNASTLAAVTPAATVLSPGAIPPPVEVVGPGGGPVETVDTGAGRGS